MLMASLVICSFLGGKDELWSVWFSLDLLSVKLWQISLNIYCFLFAQQYICLSSKSSLSQSHEQALKSFQAELYFDVSFQYLPSCLAFKMKTVCPLYWCCVIFSMLLEIYFVGFLFYFFKPVYWWTENVLWQFYSSLPVHCKIVMSGFIYVFIYLLCKSNNCTDLTNTIYGSNQVLQQ